MDFKKNKIELEKINKQKQEINNLSKNEIYKILHNILYENYEDIEDLKEAFVLYIDIENNEFWFDYPFGNISFKSLCCIDKAFRKENFEIDAVIVFDDTYKNKNGLQITFKMCL